MLGAALALGWELCIAIVALPSALAVGSVEATSLALGAADAVEPALTLLLGVPLGAPLLGMALDIAACVALGTALELPALVMAGLLELLEPTPMGSLPIGSDFPELEQADSAESPATRMEN